MKLTKKIPAFTLTEMLVVLGITSIVAGLAFSIMSIFSRNIQLIQNNYNTSTVLQLLEQQLTVDINTFPTTLYDPIDGKLSLASPIDSVVYQIGTHLIIRQTDTIFKEELAYQMYYLGKPIEKGPLDALKISFDSPSQNNFIFISRPNAADQFIKPHGH